MYCFAYFVAEVLCTVCRSVRIVRMENGIYDPRKRVVDPRNEYHYWGLEIYCFAYFVTEVLFTVCRSVRIVRMENGIHDPRKRVVDPRNEYHWWGLEILLCIFCA